tara:strand:+ start:158 stop:1000 length:843 start_codon:yes stop_codon:yes gene_type:complete
MNINTALIEGTKILKKNNIRLPQLDSEILMSKILKKDRKYLVLNLNKSIENESLKIYKDLIKKRSLGKPIAYLTGVKNFWKHEFKIVEDVLIPRPDTEILIQETLKVLKFKRQVSILDIGVGSGCILLSILKEKPNFYGTGIDISNKSIDLSKINAKNLGVQNRVKFLKTNVDNFCFGKYDLIISNPPYIKKNEIKYLDKDVNCFEPKLALDGGLDGTLKIKNIIDKTPTLLKKNGKLVLEIAYNQRNKVVELLKQKGFYINKITKDYAHNDRCIISTKI